MNILLFILLFYIIPITVYWFCIKWLMKIDKDSDFYSTNSKWILILNFLPVVNSAFSIMLVVLIITYLLEKISKKIPFKVNIVKLSKKNL